MLSNTKITGYLMNHFDKYFLKILKCSESTLVNTLFTTEYKNNAVIIKKRNSKNCVIYYIQLNPFGLSNIKTDMYRNNMPFFIKNTVANYGAGVCWILNSNYSLSHVNASKVRYINWIQQEELFKLNQLLKITG